MFFKGHLLLNIDSPVGKVPQKYLVTLILVKVVVVEVQEWSHKYKYDHKGLKPPGVEHER